MAQSPSEEAAKNGPIMDLQNMNEKMTAMCINSPVIRR